MRNRSVFPRREGFEGDKRFSVVRASVRALMIALFVIKRNNVIPTSYNTCFPIIITPSSAAQSNGSINLIGLIVSSLYIYIYILTHARKQIVAEFDPVASIIYSLCDQRVVV